MFYFHSDFCHPTRIHIHFLTGGIGEIGHIVGRCDRVQSVNFAKGECDMKNRTLLIIVGVVLLCCCVVVIAGAVAYPTIKKYLNSASSGLQNPNPASTSVPDMTNTPSPSNGGGSSASGPVDGGLGDSILKTDVWNSILNAESQRNCSDVTSTVIDVAQQPNSSGVWVEDWSANVCGNDTVFVVTFTPDPKGGTNYDIKQK